MIRPFSGAQYHRNSERCKDDENPCVICGRPVKKDGAKYLEVFDGGRQFSDGHADQNDAGYMGCFPIGSDCLREHSELKDLVIQW